MKRCPLWATVAVAAVLLSGCQTAERGPADTNCAASPPTKASQDAMTPAQALDRLKAGNQRFVSGTPIHRHLTAERVATAAGQYPFAVVLSCLDSRTSTELIFDQGLGDVFSARVAGNVLNEDILGSMEFACKVAGAKLIVVVGHTKCGAVKGACGGVELGRLTGLLARIKPAVDAVPVETGASKTDNVHVDAVARENVRLVLEQIRQQSPILAELIQSGQVGIVGGMHDLDSGKVTFLE